ncbi:MAG: hypothetical protein AMS24_05150 [Chlamydiae bacterium SM23_39]|nr:MAG: hypothetical protein AMS24_05150 [Chlamydiae bacterium SM23_39]
MIVIFIFLTFTAFLSLSETAFFSLSRFTLNTYKYSKDVKKRLVFNLLSRPRELLVTLLMLNILSNILVQNTFSNIFKNYSWSFKVGIPLILVLLFGEIFPKSFAILHGKTIAYRTSYIVSFFYHILAPFRIIITFVTNYISRFMFFFLKKEKQISSEELKHIVETSNQTGVLNVDEAQIISGYLDLFDSNVKEKMTVKGDILFYDINKDINDLIDIFVEQKYFRIPVCDGHLDKILGIISLNSFFLNQEKIKSSKEIKNFLKKPLFIPETTNSLNALIKMKKRGESIALVVDEYGCIAGLVSQEDLKEIVLGNIEDIKEVKELYTRPKEDVIIADARLELSDFEDIFNVKLTSISQQITLGGWIIEQLEKIPQSGEKLEKEGFLFYILESDPKKIKKIYIRKLL